MKLVVTLSLAVLFFGCQAQPTHTEDGVKIVNEKLDKASFSKKIAEQGIQFVDVRTAGEFNTGYINGAVNIDFLSPDFQTKILSFDKSKPIAIYCQSGARSGKASRVMVELGFVEVYDLIGGYSNW